VVTFIIDGFDEGLTVYGGDSMLADMLGSMFLGSATDCGQASQCCKCGVTPILRGGHSKKVSHVFPSREVL
jgi:hypothetical protein